MPPELALLIISTNERLASNLKALIAKNFRSRLATVTNPSAINQKIYSVDPDILIMGEESLTRAAENPKQFTIGNDPFFQGRYLIAVGEKPEAIDIDSSRYVEVSPESDGETYLEHVETAAEVMGYMTAHGNVENRLVQRDIRVSVEVEERSFEGRTTGLDLEGCGVRVKSIDPSIDEGTVCRVSLTEDDLQGFVPARGVIDQIDDSWEEGFEAYLKIDFTGEGFPSNELAREVIQDLIDRQEDESISYQRNED